MDSKGFELIKKLIDRLLEIDSENSKSLIEEAEGEYSDCFFSMLKCLLFRFS